MFKSTYNFISTFHIASTFVVNQLYMKYVEAYLEAFT